MTRASVSSADPSQRELGKLCSHLCAVCILSGWADLLQTRADGAALAPVFGERRERTKGGGYNSMRTIQNTESKGNAVIFPPRHHTPSNLSQHVFQITKPSLSRHTRCKAQSKDPSLAQVSPECRSERQGRSMHSQGWRVWTGGAQRPGSFLEGQPLKSPKTMETQSHTEPPSGCFCDNQEHSEKSQGEGKPAY